MPAESCRRGYGPRLMSTSDMADVTSGLVDTAAGDLPAMQLRMSIPASVVRELPDAAVPPGYRLRPYRPGDEAGWIRLLGSAGFADWDRGRIDEWLAGPERREGSRIVTKGPTVVAATFASRATLEQEVGALDAVASDPNYQGRGLGRAVCTAVMKFLAGRGYPAVTLQTDEWRLPAIGLYLSLGFTPVMERGDMPSRWEVVMRELKSGRR